jgi:hypothetical protein
MGIDGNAVEQMMRNCGMGWSLAIAMGHGRWTSSLGLHTMGCQTIIFNNLLDFSLLLSAKNMASLGNGLLLGQPLCKAAFSIRWKNGVSMESLTPQ